MINRLKNELKLQVEQLLLRGAHPRLLFIASLVGVAAIAGGMVVQVTDSRFEDGKSALWWAFLRLTDPEPRVQFLGFGDSSLNFDLLVWVEDPSRQYFVRSDLNFAVVKAFREGGITIPFPQRDLHLRTGFNAASV